MLWPAYPATAYLTRELGKRAVAHSDLGQLARRRALQSRGYSVIIIYRL